MFGSVTSQPPPPRSDYDALPSSERGGAKQPPLFLRASRFFKRRQIIVVILTIVTSTFLLILYTSTTAQNNVSWIHPRDTLPPLYPEYHRAELQLPQHFDKHPFSNGKKYMWVADHTQCMIYRNLLNLLR
jgi:hypothetical protein